MYIQKEGQNQWKHGVHIKDGGKGKRRLFSTEKAAWEIEAVSAKEEKKAKSY